MRVIFIDLSRDLRITATCKTQKSSQKPRASLNDAKRKNILRALRQPLAWEFHSSLVGNEHIKMACKYYAAILAIFFRGCSESFKIVHVSSQLQLSRFLVLSLYSIVISVPDIRNPS